MNLELPRCISPPQLRWFIRYKRLIVVFIDNRDRPQKEHFFWCTSNASPQRYKGGRGTILCLFRCSKLQHTLCDPNIELLIAASGQVMMSTHDECPKVSPKNAHPRQVCNCSHKHPWFRDEDFRHITQQAKSFSFEFFSTGCCAWWRGMRMKLLGIPKCGVDENQYKGTAIVFAFNPPSRMIRCSNFKGNWCYGFYSITEYNLATPVDVLNSISIGQFHASHGFLIGALKECGIVLNANGISLYEKSGYQALDRGFHEPTEVLFLR